jgi:branched-chain amino acid transport system substrate-binding protein
MTVGSSKTVRKRIAAALVVTAMLALAVSSSATAKSSAPFRVGFICSCSGFAASNFGDLPDVVTAWQRYVNANGGLRGFPVKVYYENDNDSAATALQDAQALVKDDHVQAIVDASLVDTAFEKYIAGSGVAVTGGVSQEPPFSSSPDFFPTGNGNIGPLGYGNPLIAKTRGERKWGALVCAEAPVCAGFLGPFADILKNVIGGESLVYSATISDTAPNYTAQCLAAKQAGVQALFIGDSDQVTQRVADSCAQQGIKFAYYDSSSPVSFTLKDSNDDGSTFTIFDSPVSNNSAPGVQLFNKIIDRYSPSIRGNSFWNDGAIWPFAGLQLFSQDVTTNKLTPSSSPAKVKNGLYALKGTTLGGITSPMDYVKGKVTPQTCWFSARDVNGKEVTLNGGKPQCVPANKVAAIYKAFGA